MARQTNDEADEILIEMMELVTIILDRQA